MIDAYAHWMASLMAGHSGPVTLLIAALCIYWPLIALTAAFRGWAWWLDRREA